MQNKWDVIVAGGGSSGVAAAVSSAKEGLKTLLIEKYSFLGGTSTGALVTPMMKNVEDNGTLYSEILERLSKTGDSATHENGNPGWFNPEIMKCELDSLCEDYGVEVLFDTVITGAETKNGKLDKIKCFNKSGHSELSADIFIDASGDADLADLAGVPFNKGDETGKHQAFSLRFMMADVDVKVFSQWLNEIDPDSDISVTCKDVKGQILTTTAHTWDGNQWKLRPYFEQAVKDGILKHEDGAYFQVFSVPGQQSTIAFNCPRIYSEKNLDPLNMWDISYAYKTGRKQIIRIANFCKTYLKGFENASISQIAPMLGVRDSRRIEGKYTLTEEDIFSGKKVANNVAKSNYPVDVHSQEKGKSELKFLEKGDHYEIPEECLLNEKIENLIVVGRAISATFRAQASLRIQPNCWAMGEHAGKLAKKLLLH